MEDVFCAGRPYRAHNEFINEHYKAEPPTGALELI